MVIGKPHKALYWHFEYFFHSFCIIYLTSCKNYVTIQSSIALAILVGIILLCLSDRKKVKQFDERQLIVRSRAVNLAYVTLLICLFIVLILSTMTLPWLDVPVCVILSMFVSLTVFSVYAILNNAYFTGVKKESPFGGVFLSVSLLNLFNGFRHLSNEGKEGPLDIILPVASERWVDHLCHPANPEAHG